MGNKSISPDQNAKCKFVASSHYNPAHAQPVNFPLSPVKSTSPIAWQVYKKATNPLANYTLPIDEMFGSVSAIQLGLVLTSPD
jgi:hypothetical protein